MRKVVASPYMSLDGLIALPDGTSDWPASGSERYAREILPMLFEQSDTIVLGRKTYETMVQFWPNMDPSENRFVTPMNTIPKIVFSQSLSQVSWGKWPATLVKDDPVEAMLALKQQEGKDLLIFGSGKLISTLAQADLIDDYWLQVHPLVLGSGVSLFRELTLRLDLSLLDVKPSQEGILVLHYQPARKAA
jgi:dihydrofolate reductase